MLLTSKSRFIRTLFSLCFVSIFSPLSPVLKAQSRFERAHALLEEIDRLQKQERGKTTVERLTQLVNSAPQQVEQLLNEGLVDLLNTPGAHSPEEVHQQLAAALQVVPPDQYQPEVFVFASALERQPSYFIAYNIGYCAVCSRNWIGVLGLSNGIYKILASDDNPLPDHGLAVSWLGRTVEGSARLIVGGTAWGDAHNRLSVTAYAFDGKHLTKTWSLEDLPQGTIKVTPTEIIVSFLTALVPPWSEKTEIYSILPEQIKLRQSFERANP
jgi:hypothetical protein